jgi:hypothetical protein
MRLERKLRGMKALGSSISTTRENAWVFVLNFLTTAQYTDNMDGVAATV